MVFKDRSPAAQEHLLVVPLNHIGRPEVPLSIVFVC